MHSSSQYVQQRGLIQSLWDVTRGGGTESTAQNPLLLVQCQVKSDVDDGKTTSRNGQGGLIESLWERN